MSVTSTPVPDWRAAKLRFKRNVYPVPGDRNLPRLYFVGLFVGARGSGKTWCIAQLLKQYEQHGIFDAESNQKMAQRVVVFSPTVDANPVFTALKHMDTVDVVSSYSDAKLLSAVADVKREREETLEYQRKMRIYRRFLRVKRVDEMDPHDLMELEMAGFEPPAEPKYPHGVVTFFVLDDLVGSSAFKAVGKSALTNLVLRNRHLGINILIATQALKCVPKSIRTNASLFCIFKFASKKIVTEDLYEEVSNIMTIAQFEDLYEFATRDEHDALIMDFSQPKDERFKRNWDTLLHF